MDPFVFLSTHHTLNRPKVAQQLMKGIDLVADTLANQLGIQ